MFFEGSRVNGVRICANGQTSKNQNTSDLFGLKLFQNVSNIFADTNGLPLDFPGTNCLPSVNTGVGSVRVLGCHLPERIFDDDRGIIANAQFQKEDFPACTGTEEILIPLHCSVPALVLDKLMI